MGDQLYKGRLRDGSVVLVKCLKLKQKHSPQALQHHMEVISKLRHRHLVSVLGHCIVPYHDHPSSATTVFIVLENMSNASLRDHLIGTPPIIGTMCPITGLIQWFQFLLIS